MLRSGADYLAGLRDGRSVLLDGERVADVTRHAHLCAPALRVADLYDARRADPEGWCAGASALEEDVGSSPTPSAVRIGPAQAVGAEWLIPTTGPGLARRRRAHQRWARGTYGLMGRSPDHVASVLTGFAASREVFARGGPEFADNVARFHQQAREHDLYLSYAIVPPQIDRSKPAHAQPEPFLYAGVTAEKDDGILVSGAQQIATSALISDWIFVSYIVPLSPGDEDYAVSFVVPTAAPGVRLYPRRPYASATTTRADYPLSSQFDEADCFLVLDDVFVPWDQVFVYRDIELCKAQFFETGSHQLANFQSLVRFVVKLEFLAGLARSLTALHGTDSRPDTQALVGGQVGAMCAALDAITRSAETQAVEQGGWLRPHPRYVYAGMSLQRRWIMDLMRALRELAGGSVIALPSSEAAFDSDVTRADTERYFGAVGTSARERVRFLKLFWDAVGTEFAGRQTQYEMFYSAGQQVVDMRLFRTYDWDESVALVDECLAELDDDHRAASRSSASLAESATSP